MKKIKTPLGELRIPNVWILALLFVSIISILFAIGKISLPMRCHTETTTFPVRAGEYPLEGFVHTKCHGLFEKEFWKKDESSPTASHQVATNEIHAVFPTDYSNDKNLVGSAHNVFIGKVIEKTGEKSKGSLPEAQYDVDIMDNIKGELKGIITVNQEGGFIDGVLHKIEGGYDDHDDDPFLLQPGFTYIFATRYNDAENWHNLNPFHTGRKLITNNSDLSPSEITDLINANDRVVALKSAYTEEILLESDVANNNALNSFESLPAETKEALRQEN